MPLNEGAVNDILLFAPDGTEGAGDLMTLAEYAAHADRLRGHQAGLAKRALENRVLRQTSLMAAGLAQYIANRHAGGVVDNADIDSVETGLTAAISAMIAAAIAEIDLPDAAPSTLGRHTIFVPAGALTAAATGGAALYQAAPGGGAHTLKGWSFSDTTNQAVEFPVWMPKSWDAGILHLKLAWFRAGDAVAGNVRWKAEALARVAGGSVAHSYVGAVTATVTSAAVGAGLQAETAEIALDLTGAAASSWLDIRLTRDAADTVNDTLAEAAILIGHATYYITNAATDD